MSRNLDRELKLGGREYLVGASGTRVRVMVRDNNGKIKEATGATVPTDGDAGYAVGAKFTQTDGTIGSAVYINEGSTTSCDFNVIPTRESKVIFGSTETIAAGGTSTALSLTKAVHYIDADAGGDTFTLADGEEGQIMTIAMASATGTATITPTNLRGGTSVTFNAAGDSVILQFIASEWNIMGGNSYAVV
jgi:hypothetical protein